MLKAGAKALLVAGRVAGSKLLAKQAAKQLPKAAAKVCSFTEDTPVLMCDGSLRAIQEVEEGEWVLAQNEETGEVSCRQVVAPYDNPGRSIILVTLEDTDGHTEVIETTDNHPFYVEGRGWTRVDELRPGDMIPSAERGLLMVAGLEWTSRIETVYNFGVDEYHTYFVGEVGAWVHNCYDLVRHVNGLPKRARLSQNAEDVFTQLETHNGISRHLASERLHRIKNENGFGGADNVVFDMTGNVFNPRTGELMGSLTQGGAK